FHVCHLETSEVLEGDDVQGSEDEGHDPDAPQGKAPPDTRGRVVDEDLGEVDDDKRDRGNYGTPGEEEPEEPEQEDRLVPVRDLDHAEGRARELGRDALDDLLVRVVRGRDVERRLPELHG